MKDVPLDGIFDLTQLAPPSLEALGDALRDLESRDPELSRIVHLRYFVGLTHDEIAQLLEVSPRTVKRKWAAARLWLFREISNA